MTCLTKMPALHRYSLCVMISLTAGCGTTLKRYSSMDPAPVTDTSVAVSIYSLPLPPTDAKTILNLSERGQAAAIAALALRTETPGELLAAAASPLEAPTPL